MKRKTILSAVLGLVALVAGAVACTIFQICFVQSFWLHAIVAPLNPQTISQPTSLTHIGVACQIFCTAFFLVGAFLLLRAGWLLFAHFRNRHDSNQKSPEPNAVAAAVVIHAASRWCLGFLR